MVSFMTLSLYPRKALPVSIEWVLGGPESWSACFGEDRFIAPVEN